MSESDADLPTHEEVRGIIPMSETSELTISGGQLFVYGDTHATAANTVTFYAGAADRELLRITADGQMVLGGGLSADEATQTVAKMLVEQTGQVLERAILVERERAAKIADEFESDADPEAGSIIAAAIRSLTGDET